MDAAEVNGGNAEEVARLVSNLETANSQTTDSPTKQQQLQEKPAEKHYQGLGSIEDVELNGEAKGNATSPRKLRKVKAKSTGAMEVATTPIANKGRGRKRKASGPEEVLSDDSGDFLGFDVQDAENIGSGYNIIIQLIAKLESSSTSPTKQGRKSLSQTNVESKKRAEEKNKLNSTSPTKKNSEASESESVDSNSLNNDVAKMDVSPVKSANSSVNNSPIIGSPKPRGRPPRVDSPNKTVGISNPLYKEPFKFGWKRELVRADSTPKKVAEVFYYSPTGKKLKTYKEIAPFLNTKNLTVDNFTFELEPIGINDPEKEIIHEARKPRDSMGSAMTQATVAALASPTAAAVDVAKKKGTAGRKKKEVVTAAAASVAAAAMEQNPDLTITPVIAKAKPNSHVVTNATLKPLPQPASPKGRKSTNIPAKITPVANVKVTPRGPGRRGAPKKEIVKTEEVEMLPPSAQWPSPTVGRRGQVVVDKPGSAKSKRGVKKFQEPCSIRCPNSMGMVPSLNCSICLCMYHPKCVGESSNAENPFYICQNCKPETSDTPSDYPISTPPTSSAPPPLIPISMLGSQNLKLKHPSPRMQKPSPKHESSADQRNTKFLAQARSPRAASASPADKRDGTRFSKPQREGTPSSENAQQNHLPKAQNIAVIGGKKYIVVPKNNATSTPSARANKIADKPASKPPREDKSPVEKLPLSDGYQTPSSPYRQADETSSLSSTPIEQSPRLTIDDKIANETDKLDELETSQATSMDIGMEIDESVVTDERATIALETLLDNATEITPNNLDIARESTMVVKPLDEKKQQQPVMEIDTRQNFMTSVCAGYHTLYRIFQYLKVQELLRAARVCKMWRDLAAHPTLWKTVRMKNSQVADWDGFADSLKRNCTQHLDLRKMLLSSDPENVWKQFVRVIPRVTSLLKLELCRCPEMVVEEVIKNCPQLEVLSATFNRSDNATLNFESIGNLKQCQELRLKAVSGMSIKGELTPLRELTRLTHLSLTSVKDLGKKNLEVIQTFENLETLELGECSDFPDKFGTEFLIKLKKLERLRLEKGQGTCCTFDILEGISKLDNLMQLELINFDVKNGFDKCLANCKNIKKLLIIPTYISQSATTNNMVLGGVTELSANLTIFVWGVTLELLRVTELFVDQCNQVNKPASGDCIPVLKPVPCLNLIKKEGLENDGAKDEKVQLDQSAPQVDILPLPELQQLLGAALPNTRVKILKIPFHATWAQNISESAQ